MQLAGDAHAAEATSGPTRSQDPARRGCSSSSSSRRSLVSDSLNSRMPLPIERPTSGSFFGPEDDQGDDEDDDELHAVRRWACGVSFAVRSQRVSAGAGAERYPLVTTRRWPRGRSISSTGLGVDARGEVLPAVVADDEDDVALVQLVGDAHRDRGDRARGDAREEALLVEQLARPDDRVAVGDEDLAVQQREVDDRRDEAVVERAQALDRLALHRLGGDDLDVVAELLLEAPAVAHQRAAGAEAGDEGADARRAPRGSRAPCRCSARSGLAWLPYW